MDAARGSRREAADAAARAVHVGGQTGLDVVGCKLLWSCAREAGRLADEEFQAEMGRALELTLSGSGGGADVLRECTWVVRGNSGCGDTGSKHSGFEVIVLFTKRRTICVSSLKFCRDGNLWTAEVRGTVQRGSVGIAWLWEELEAWEREDRGSVQPGAAVLKQSSIAVADPVDVRAEQQEVEQCVPTEATIQAELLALREQERESSSLATPREVVTSKRMCRVQRQSLI